MIKDLMLTDTGDIVLIQKKNQGHKIELLFFFSESKPIALDFDFYNRNTNLPILPFCLTFCLDEEDVAVKEKIITGKKAVEQQIKWALNTAITERSYDASYGSELERQMHKNAKSKNYLLQTAMIAKEAIDKLNLFEDYTVTALYNKEKSLSKQSFIITFSIVAHSVSLDIDWQV